MKPELEIFQEFIRKRGLRRTPEREWVLEEIIEIHGHFDVDELYLKLKQKGVKVSKASIYRALPLFRDAGLIREAGYADGHWHYEHIYGHSHHSHIKCLGCGEMVEFEEPSPQDVEEQWGKKYRYRIVALEVQGYCPSCQEER